MIMNLKQTLTIENMKCGGCTSTIIDRLSALESVNSVEVDLGSGTVTFESPHQRVDTVRQTLLKLGYPEPGTSLGVSKMAANARSFVSCAIGKVSAST
jgi:copper chaperone